MSRPPPKLRSTCRSCADSKVKCNKKKPTCSRCEARCIPCEYVQARRPGRVPGSFARASSHPSRSSTASLDQRGGGLDEGQTNDAFLSLAATPFGLSCACGTTIHRREPFTSTPPDDIFWEDGAGMDIDPLKLLSMSEMVDSNPDFTVTMDLMPSIVVEDSSTLDPNGRLNNQATTSATHSPTSPTSLGLSYSPASAASSDINSVGPSSLCSAMNRVDPSDQAPTSNYGNAQSPFHHLEDLQSDGFSHSPDQSTCQCMQQALGMLKILSGPRGSLHTQMPGHDLAAEFVKNNNRDITAVLNILACKLCNNDSFLFMIVLTITTKILARYASTASMRGATNPVSGSSSSVCSLSGSTDKYAERLVDIAHALGEKGTLTPVVEVEDHAQSSLREAAQRVLQELHRIHKLISELAIRSKELDRQESRPSSSQPKLPAPVAQPSRGSNGHKQNHLATTFMVTAGEEISTPLSVRTFDLMIGDMRRSMAMLSVVLRGLLRNS